MPLCDTMLGEIERLQRQRFEHDPLMHGACAKTAGEVLGRHDMERKASVRDFAFEPLRGGFRGINIEDFSPLDAQRFAHRVKAVKDGNAASRVAELWRGRPDFLAFDVPGGARLLPPGSGRCVWARRRIRRVFMFGGGSGPGAGAI